MIRFQGRAILLDIEGTVSPISFFYDVLFPYARRQLESFLRENGDDPDVVTAREQIARDAGAAVDVLTEVNRLMDADAKTTGLKQLQGLIWKRGYASGELKSELFDDVAPSLRAWAERGIDVRIYSSGSVAAQRVFFRYTTAGDLSPFLKGYYDTTTGPKRSAESYRCIGADIGAPAGEILFLSDIVAELDAAASVGLQTGLVIRPGNAPVADGISHARLESIAGVHISSP